jgi:hypothetical protein
MNMRSRLARVGNICRWLISPVLVLVMLPFLAADTVTRADIVGEAEPNNQRDHD